MVIESVSGIRREGKRKEGGEPAAELVWWIRMLRGSFFSNAAHR